MKKFSPFQFWLRFSLTFAIVLWMTWGRAAIAQIPDFLPLGSLGEPTQVVEGYDVGPVYLEGRKLFWVTASPAQTQQQIRPLQERIDSIEKILNTTLASNFDPSDGESLQFVLEESEETRLLILKLNGQWLMTVTPKDAEANGRTNTELWAREVIQIVKTRLIESKLDRQPPAIARQIGFVAATIAGVLLLSLLSRKRQTDLLQQWSTLRGDQGIESPEQSAAEEPNEVRIKTQYLSERNLCYLQIRLLQLLQLVIWGGGLFIALGLLSYTRWIQPVLLSWLPLPLKIIGISIATYLVLRISEVLVDRFFIALETDRLLDPNVSKRVEKRFETIGQVFNGLMSTLVISVGILAGLSVFGIELGPVLAGAGIIGLGISFASQGLIKDFINGFFIILEDQYAVGDVIKVGEYAGLVENMNLRITQLRNGEGNLITLPNSSITVVENLSKEWARANIFFTVSYQADLNQVLDIVMEVADELARDFIWSERILNAREVIGVENIAQDGVTILVWIRTKPLEQWSVGREFRRRLKYALEEHNIDMGIPQQKLLWASQATEHPPFLDPS
ncbi:MAG: mechanosensitive ion channel family protein [Prochlorotrichaceae cyanobacterium]